jgi:hypothetical protein
MGNARLHRVSPQLDGLRIRRRPNPPFRPDLAPCDFWLFAYVKLKLAGHSFRSPEALFGEMEEIIFDIPNCLFTRRLEEWKQRLLRCLEAKGEYI